LKSLEVQKPQGLKPQGLLQLS